MIDSLALQPALGWYQVPFWLGDVSPRGRRHDVLNRRILNLFLGSAELTRGADEGAAPDGGLPQPFELLVEFLVPRGVCTQTPRGLSEGWLAVPKEAADTVLEEQHVKMGIHGWVTSQRTGR